MDFKEFPLPRIDDYQAALNIAQEALREKNPGKICRNADARWNSSEKGGKMTLPLLNREVEITYPRGEVVYEGGEESPSLQEQILILHYLLQVRDTFLMGKLITFREIPSGEFYYEAFLKRAQIPLLNSFGQKPERLLVAGQKLGGKKANLGDVSMTFRPFPKIPLTLVLWRGDEEFPPNGSILFDSTIGLFLSGEDIAFLSGTVVYKLLALT
ncbi:MAG: hypothetical protein CO171_02705 [Syntrophobacterales bacterium CG_4_9_14_3_um_filter_49_8]|nr:MAG: hypothetical protein CO171_02705 [Syntrophobacterales bacterium CG_4_9_14_3_um_filter_49_8]